MGISFGTNRRRNNNYYQNPHYPPSQLLSSSSSSSYPYAPGPSYPTHPPPPPNPYATHPPPPPPPPPPIYNSYHYPNGYGTSNYTNLPMGRSNYGPFYAHQQNGWIGVRPPLVAPPPLTPPPYVEHQNAKKVRNDVNVHKDTLRLEVDEQNPDNHLISFVFDALFDGRHKRRKNQPMRQTPRALASTSVVVSLSLVDIETAPVLIWGDRYHPGQSLNLRGSQGGISPHQARTGGKLDQSVAQSTRGNGSEGRVR
ncbi:unnamed protein product [Ilex paraguariensis]|uniref:RING-type E3 ubiquitin transferase n=1 Tax=Ilex paraguariensis TaxID=185542 RepID=A0ABC8SXR3_9AQUA